MGLLVPQMYVEIFYVPTLTLIRIFDFDNILVHIRLTRNIYTCIDSVLFVHFSYLSLDFAGGGAGNGGGNSINS